MDYNKAKHWFWRFKDIQCAHHANTWMSLRQLDKETQIALRYYMADMGCLVNNGKFFQWWEVDTKEWVAIPAKISTEGFLTQKNIIRRHDRVYVEGYNETWAIRNAKMIK